METLSQRELRPKSNALGIIRRGSAFSADPHPAYKDAAGFDFASSEINEAMVGQLHRCEFMADADNIVLIGGPGTGKPHVATALGVQAVEHHRKRCGSSPPSIWWTRPRRKKV